MKNKPPNTFELGDPFLSVLIDPVRENDTFRDLEQNRPFTIGEVANMLGIKESTLRYYEKEFPQLTPQKSKTGRRQFTYDDLHLIKKIMFLKDEGLKLSTIRKRLEEYITDKKTPRSSNPLSKRITLNINPQDVGHQVHQNVSLGEQANVSLELTNQSRLAIRNELQSILDLLQENNAV